AILLSGLANRIKVITGKQTWLEAPDKSVAALAQEVDAHINRTDNPHNVQAQQVPYNSGVVGFSPADVKAALDALAGVRIVEMGSNANGQYVRWENGLQVCWFANNPTPGFTARTEGAVSGYVH